MKIIFIDHSFHKKTRSSDFFFDLLASRHSVERLYVNPNVKEELLSLDIVYEFDVAVLWQMDFLAPLVLARGIRTLVVPMYDGSALMPDLHWLLSSQARFVNFSRRLHDRMTLLGCGSKLVKYFLPPVPAAERARFDDGLRVMLWQRRPEEGINLSLVERLFGDQLQAVHIHDEPDDPKVDTTPYMRRSLHGYELTTSHWFQSRAEFDQLLTRSNVLIAPRQSEGIGMAMLEGFARGMLVVAKDAPTHDEYVANWINGVLFDINHVGLADFGGAAAMGEMAWHTAVSGHAKWVASELDLLEFIEQIPKPEAVSDVDLDVFGGSLVRSYLGGLDTYGSFLLSSALLVERMSAVPLEGRLDAAGRFAPDGVIPPQGRLDQTPELTWIDQNRMDAAALASGRYVLEGAMLHAEGHAWVLGESIAIGFRTDPQLGATRLLRLHYTLPPDANADTGHCLMLNGCTLRISRFDSRGGVMEYPIPPQAMKRDNELSLIVNAKSFVFGNEAPVSLGIKKIELV
ncbi:glycosyltransferase [Bosea sp. TAF32]|uniref:glycosyltransferase n=1 Tax=Bosea sp. TAF32 TaxID=3237482 RepID=UPI003F8FD990